MDDSGPKEGGGRKFRWSFVQFGSVNSEIIIGDRDEFLYKRKSPSGQIRVRCGNVAYRPILQSLLDIVSPKILSEGCIPLLPSCLATSANTIRKYDRGRRFVSGGDWKIL